MVQALKYSDMVNWTVKEIDIRVEQAQEVLFDLKMKNSTGQLKTTHHIPIIKKNIARLLTARKEVASGK